MLTFRLAASALAFVLAANPALAAVDDGFCRNGGFPSESAEFGLARVKPGPRTHFLFDMDGCPSASESCRTRGYGYVVPGDTVITGRVNGDYVCAYYPSKGGGTAGWVDRSRLVAVAVNRKPGRSAWTGEWSDEGNPAFNITFKARRFSIDGEAYWPGPVHQPDWPDGWPHVGSVSGVLKVSRNRASYDDGTCQLDLRLVGPFLLVRDNGDCGGANVRFNGVYQRTKG